MRGELTYSSNKPAMEIVSLNCNKLKIITQYVSYIVYIIFESILWGGGDLLEGGGLFDFFTQKGGGLRSVSLDLHQC